MKRESILSDNTLKYFGVTYLLIMFIAIIYYLFSDNTIWLKLGYVLSLVAAYYLGMGIYKFAKWVRK